MEKRIVLVTGASSGIGRAVARLFAREGYTVYGTSRRAHYETAGEQGAAYTMIPLTLEDGDSVAAAVRYVVDRHGRIDVLVNNAGSGIAGAIEETSAGEAMAQFDVCFFGAVRVLSHVLPVMRAARRGSVINIGSLAACFPVPFQGMYSAAKSALFSMTTALRMELLPFGVRACVIEPGNTRTAIIQSRRYTKTTCDTAYRPAFERALCVINSDMAAHGPEKCASVVLKAARMKNPPARISVGLENKVLCLLARFASWRFKEKMIGRVYLKRDPAPDAQWTFEKQFRR